MSDDIYRVTGRETDGELYSRKRMHELVDRIAEAMSLGLRNEDHIKEVEKDVAELKELLNKYENRRAQCNDAIFETQRRVDKLEDKVGGLVKFGWMVVTAIIGVSAAYFMPTAKAAEPTNTEVVRTYEWLK